MKKLLLLLSFIISMNVVLANQYLTLGTGVKYTLDDLVTNSSGRVTYSSGSYFINDTVIINTNDTVIMNTDATVKFMLNTYIGTRLNGILLIDPATAVTFTANNITDGYLGVRLDSSYGSVIRKLVMEYAVSFRINDCNPLLDSCTFRYNNNLASTSFGNGAIALFRASPVIRNCSFIENRRAAIQGGANISNAPKILNNYFYWNNTSNANVPTINLGATNATGLDTAKIIGNTIIGGSTASGGIGFLPVGNVYAVINGNLIRRNRYGITLNGGANINAVISYNVIDTNNIQNDPNLGGSGIAFSGGSSTSQQNTIVTGNIIRANLWGITIQGRSRPNLGNLSNSDTTDDGKNRFINNTNTTTDSIDLYNNTVDSIKAENNYWDTDDPLVAEQRIFHLPDNAALGPVDFDPILTAATLPVTLTVFDVSLQGERARLVWQTATEENASHFNIQRSLDGRSFATVAKVAAAGHSGSVVNYQANDLVAGINSPALYYRLQAVDKDGSSTYSSIRKIRLDNRSRFAISPNPASSQVSVTGEGRADIRIVNMAGQLVFRRTGLLPATGIDISMLKKGVYVITITGEQGTSQSEKLVIR
ncbi:MAG TPA: T9SS type A sorting domain-containing protein [Chitinophagaceae bacterium]